MDDIKVLNISDWTEYLFVWKTVLHWAPKSSLSFVTQSISSLVLCVSIGLMRRMKNTDLAIVEI